MPAPARVHIVAQAAGRLGAAGGREVAMPRVFADPLRERVARCSAVLSLDATCSAAALGAALVLRFEEGTPGPYPAFLPGALALVVAARLAANAAARLHRWEFRLAGFDDAVRIAGAALLGSALFVPLSALLLPEPLPRTVYALEFFLSSAAFSAIRFGPRFALRWWGERRRRRSGAAPTLVVGVNFAAELLARDLVRTPSSPYDVVGFVGADASDVGIRLDGKPVLGVVADLAGLVARHRVRIVLLAIPRPAAAGLREVIAACARRGVTFKILPACASVAEPVSAAMLDDLAPEDLLPRLPSGPGRGELRRRVAGRRVLVTGAAAGVGGEICRQLVHHGVRQLVMVDGREDELYRRARRLAAERPDVDVRAEVADLRDPSGAARLGERYRPEVVFHAPVGGPLGLAGERQGAPASDDDLGARHVARMARACGARRLVLVHLEEGDGPTGAAGAAQRGAELVAHELAPSRTQLTAVRLENVLASAASVVPLPGGEVPAGPGVTVTRPDRPRRFVTVPEAARLVLAAGLDERRERRIEVVGAPIELRELARLAIALSRREAPGRGAGSAPAAGPAPA